ncbi:hypothetical protein ABFX02_08G077500 [Erythranthe guttata]
MTLFRLSIVFVFFFVVTFVAKNAFPWVTDSPSWIVQIVLLVFGYANLSTFIAAMAMNLLVNIIAEVWNRPRGLGLWDALWYKFEPSETNECLISVIQEEYCATDVKILTEFDWDTIVAATNNFSDSNVVGRGKSGSTTIYKALLVEPSGDQLVAVKRFSPSSGIGGLNQYMNEIFLLPKLEHPNIIKLIGYCVRGKEKLLVHEFMPMTKSLDSWLQISSMCKESFTLNQWSNRFKMIIEIAEGVAYLHEYSGLRVVHGDLKLSNILLDRKMKPKISGFASAESMTNLSNRENMSPEYISLQMKEDIHSFGVIVLVMMSGTRVTTNSDTMSLINYAKMVRNTGFILGMVEGPMMGTCDADEAWRCLEVGLLCTQQDPVSRPAMTWVPGMLQGDY